MSGITRKLLQLGVASTVISEKNNFNTKLVLLEHILNSDEVGIDIQEKTETMLIHDKALDEEQEVTVNRCNDITMYINQYPQKEDTIYTELFKKGTRRNKIIKETTDRLALSIALPYRTVFRYTQQNVAIPPSRFVIQLEGNKTFISLPHLQVKYCTGVSPNDKIAFLRHAIVLYYILDHSNKIIMGIEDEESDEEELSPEKTKRMDIQRKEREAMANTKAEIVNNFLHSRMGRNANPNIVNEQLDALLKSIDRTSKIPVHVPERAPQQNEPETDNISEDDSEDDNESVSTTRQSVEPASANLNETEDLSQMDTFELNKKQRYVIVEFHNGKYICHMYMFEEDKWNKDDNEFMLSVDDEKLIIDEILPPTYSSIQNNSYPVTNNIQAIPLQDVKILRKGKQTFEKEKILKHVASLIHKFDGDQMSVVEWLNNKNIVYFNFESINNFEHIVQLGGLVFSKNPQELFPIQSDIFNTDYLLKEILQVRRNTKNLLVIKLRTLLKNKLRELFNYRGRVYPYTIDDLTKFLKVKDIKGNTSPFLKALYIETVGKQMLNDKSVLHGKIDEFIENTKIFWEKINVEKKKQVATILMDALSIFLQIPKQFIEAGEGIVMTKFIINNHTTLENPKTVITKIKNTAIHFDKNVDRKVKHFMLSHLYDEKDWLTDCNEDAAATLDELQEQQESLARQIELEKERLERERKRQEEQQRRLEEQQRRLEELQRKKKIIGIAPFVFNEFGENSIKNLQIAFEQYLHNGLQQAEPGDRQDFYGETYLDFFQHLHKKRRSYKVFNEPVRYAYNVNNRSYSKDHKIYKSVVENIDTLNVVNDLKNLNSEDSNSNWSTIVKFALYEKYNYFLPFLHTNLNEEIWKNLNSNRVFEDFIYVYCLLYTLIFNKNKT